MQAITFTEWMKKVDSTLEGIIGLSHDDLPDILYRDMYDDGASPKEAAREALENAGYE